MTSVPLEGIHKILKDKLSKSAIARKLGIARETVIKYSKLPEGYVPVIKREVAETTIDPYLPSIAMMLEEAHKLGISIPTASIYALKEMPLGYKKYRNWVTVVLFVGCRMSYFVMIFGIK